MNKNFGIVIIGQNEGERLREALEPVSHLSPWLVYVDSGSTDQSVEVARSRGVSVLCLDSSAPYSAARGRNAGFNCLLERNPSLEFVQFVDGDSELAPDWLPAALGVMSAGPHIAAVSGRRREKFPRRSLYHRLFEVEWNKSGETDGGKRRPRARTARAGAVETDTSGGDALVRVSAFREVGGFDATLRAGEEPELCFRLRQKGWKILRVDSEMTLHEGKISCLSQWARRRIRAGCAAKDIFWRTGEKTYSRQIQSVRLWTVGWLGALLTASGGALYFWGPATALAPALAVTLALPLQMFRVALRALRSGNDWKSSLAYGVFTVLGKWPEAAGQILSRRERSR